MLKEKKEEKIWETKKIITGVVVGYKGITKEEIFFQNLEIEDGQINLSETVPEFEYD